VKIHINVPENIFPSSTAVIKICVYIAIGYMYIGFPVHKIEGTGSDGKHFPHSRQRQDLEGDWQIEKSTH
jgi:hypothetical protein